MNKAFLTAITALTLGATSAAHAHDLEKIPVGKEKCYGVAKAGKNHCGAADGSHSCAGLAKTDNNPVDWILVAEGTCKDLGGKVNQKK